MIKFEDWLAQADNVPLASWGPTHTKLAEMYARAVLEAAGAQENQGTLFGDEPDPDPSPCPHQKIVAMYHEMLCPPLRQMRAWSGNREEMLRARWNEDPERQSLMWWRAYFAKVRTSSFLMGQLLPVSGVYPAGVRKWKPDLEWLVRPNNLPKVIEGAYDDDKPDPDGGAANYGRGLKTL